MTAATGMGGTLPDVEDDVDVFASFRPLTEGPVFIGLQVCYVAFWVAKIPLMSVSVPLVSILWANVSRVRAVYGMLS